MVCLLEWYVAKRNLSFGEKRITFKWWRCWQFGTFLASFMKGESCCEFSTQSYYWEILLNLNSFEISRLYFQNIKSNFMFWLEISLCILSDEFRSNFSSRTNVPNRYLFSVEFGFLCILQRFTCTYVEFPFMLDRNENNLMHIFFCYESFLFI